MKIAIIQEILKKEISEDDFLEIFSFIFKQRKISKKLEAVVISACARLEICHSCLHEKTKEDVCSRCRKILKNKYKLNS